MRKSVWKLFALSLLSGFLAASALNAFGMAQASQPAEASVVASE